MVYDAENERFKSLFELLSDGQGSTPVPEAFDAWQQCVRCQGRFWFRSTTDIQRHSHLRHDSLPIVQLCPTPYRCGFRLPRPIVAGLPSGEFTYCGRLFSSSKHLEEHKETEGHKVTRPVLSQPTKPPESATAASQITTPQLGEVPPLPHRLPRFQLSLPREVRSVLFHGQTALLLLIPPRP
jgi:hypothetical protein